MNEVGGTVRRSAGLTLLAAMLGGSACAAQDGTPPEPPPSQPWRSISTSVAGCAIERLNLEERPRLFTWQDCPQGQACQVARLEGPFVSVTAFLGSTTLASAGSDERALIAMVDPSSFLVVVTNDEGLALDGYRAPYDPEHRCLMATASIFGDRWGALVSHQEAGARRLGGLLGTLGGELQTFTVDPLPTGMGPAPVILGEQRWMMRWWSPRLYSVDARRGDDLVEVSPFDATSTIEQGPLATDGQTFFVQRISTGAPMASRIDASDGRSPPTPFVEPGPGAFDGVPAFTGSHVTWFRGRDASSVNRFQSVEVWATPWTPGQQMLPEPFRVAVFPGQHMPTDVAAGHGYLAAPIDTQGRQVVVYDVGKTSERVIALPGNLRAWHHAGLSKDALWTVAASGPGNRGDLLVRLPL